MADDLIVEADVDRLAGHVQGDTADLPVADAEADAARPETPDLGDRKAGVLTLVRRAVLEAETGGDGGDDLAGAVTLMRREVAETEDL